MKIVVQVRLFPEREQEAALRATLTTCTAAANAVSEVAWDRRVFRGWDLRKITYGQVRSDWALASQPAQMVIRKVVDAYKKDKKTKRAFRPDGAQPFDDRCLSWQIDPEKPGGTVSIWTVKGRMKGLRFAGSPEQVALLRSYRQGESDLVWRDGKWFLVATCDVSEAPLLQPRGWVGVDMGIVNIATTSDGLRLSGKHLNRVRHRNRHLRTKLQKKGTKSAKRLLKKRSRKEARFAADLNHKISKRIVTEAERTGRGIAIENLAGIRSRVRFRKPQRVTLHTWAFAQLGQYLAYKAQRAGVALVEVPAAYTSQTCSACGHVDKRSRKSQSEYICSSCGVVAHADENAARNIAARGDACWAAVNRPHAA